MCFSMMGGLIGGNNRTFSLPLNANPRNMPTNDVLSQAVQKEILCEGIFKVEMLKEKNALH